MLWKLEGNKLEEEEEDKVVLFTTSFLKEEEYSLLLKSVTEVGEIESLEIDLLIKERGRGALEEETLWVIFAWFKCEKFWGNESFLEGMEKEEEEVLLVFTTEEETEVEDGTVEVILEFSTQRESMLLHPY